jgi:hypothetical protein
MEKQMPSKSYLDRDVASPAKPRAKDIVHEPNPWDAREDIIMERIEELVKIRKFKLRYQDRRYNTKKELFLNKRKEQESSL